MSVEIPHRLPPVNPENAYGEAPSISSEITWIADRTVRRAFGEPMGREFWLRKAAAFDRIALAESATYTPDVAARAVETAEAAAARLADFDHTHCTTCGPLAPLLNAQGLSYRPYVRQEYLSWITNGANCIES